MKNLQQIFWIRTLILLTTGMALAQAPDIEWQKSLGGSNSDQAQYIQQTLDGGYIIAGISGSNNGDVSGNHGNSDFWVVKLTPTGTLDWQKSLGGSGIDGAATLQQTIDGGYIIAGSSNSADGDVIGNHGGYDFWILKLDESGNFDGQSTLGGSGDDYAYSIQQTLDGGYIIAGESNSTDFDVTGNQGGPDYWIVKTSNQGSIEWQKSLGGSGNDRANAIRQTTDGGYIVAGYSNSTDGDVSGNHGGVDYWVVKLNIQGIIEWQESLGGSASDAAYSIQQTTDGGYIVAGLSLSNDGDVSGNQGQDDYWIVKMNASGGIEWQKSLGGSEMDRANSINETADGGYIVAGHSLSTDGDVSGNHGLSDYWLVNLNASGVIEWEKALGGSDSDRATSISQTTDGGYIVAGYSHSTNGDVTGNHGGSDYWIVKLEPDPLSLNEFNRQITLYPNPVSTVLNIVANEPIKSIAIFNSLGQEVMASSHFETNLQLNMSGLPPNIYLVIIITEKSRQTFKIAVR